MIYQGLGELVQRIHHFTEKSHPYWCFNATAHSGSESTSYNSLRLGKPPPPPIGAIQVTVISELEGIYYAITRYILYFIGDLDD